MGFALIPLPDIIPHAIIIHQQWLLDRQEILRERGSDLKIFSEDEYQKIMIFFANFIQTLGVQLSVRQQVIATATVYFKRFYARNCLKNIDPLLLAPTCIFLASKSEESGLISQSKLISYAQAVLKTKLPYAYPQKEFPFKIAQVWETEFFLLEMMDCCLIVFHPYRPLLQLFQDIGPEGNEQLLSTAWKVCNDSLRTDVSLMYPPHIIALGCLHVASVMVNKDLKQWFAELSVDMGKVWEVVRQVMSLYQLWKGFDERKETSALLQRIPKSMSPPANGQPTGGGNGAR